MDNRDFSLDIYSELLKCENNTKIISNFAQKKKLDIPSVQKKKKKINSMDDQSKEILSNFTMSKDESELKNFYIIWG